MYVGQLFPSSRFPSFFFLKSFLSSDNVSVHFLAVKVLFGPHKTEFSKSI